MFLHAKDGGLVYEHNKFLLIGEAKFTPQKCNPQASGAIAPLRAYAWLRATNSGQGLLILRCESHAPLYVGLVWFGRSTF